jgi:hypothetical protein
MKVGQASVSTGGMGQFTGIDLGAGSMTPTETSQTNYHNYGATFSATPMIINGKKIIRVSVSTSSELIDKRTFSTNVTYARETTQGGLEIVTIPNAVRITVAKNSAEGSYDIPILEDPISASCNPSYESFQ